MSGSRAGGHRVGLAELTLNPLGKLTWSIGLWYDETIADHLTILTVPPSQLVVRSGWSGSAGWIWTRSIVWKILSPWVEGVASYSRISGYGGCSRQKIVGSHKGEGWVFIRVFNKLECWGFEAWKKYSRGKLEDLILQFAHLKLNVQVNCKKTNITQPVVQWCRWVLFKMERKNLNISHSYSFDPIRNGRIDRQGQFYQPHN